MISCKTAEDHGVSYVPFTGRGNKLDIAAKEREELSLLAPKSKGGNKTWSKPKMTLREAIKRTPHDYDRLKAYLKKLDFSQLVAAAGGGLLGHT